MALSGFKAKAHPQQVSRRWPDDVDEVDDRATHPLDFAELDERLGPFTVDVAAAAHNAKCVQPCPGCLTDSDRALWARLAAEAEGYLRRESIGVASMPFPDVILAHLRPTERNSIDQTPHQAGA